MGKRKKSTRVQSKLRRKIRKLEQRLQEYSDSSSYSSRSENYSDKDIDYESDDSAPRHDIQSAIYVPVQNEAEAQTDRPNNDQVDIEAQPRPIQSLPNGVASTNAACPPTAVDTASTPALPADILEALGESKIKDEVFGPPIREEVSKRWDKIIMEGLSKEQLQKLLDGILIPENFQMLKAPKLNLEVSAVLNESSRNRDKRLDKCQNQLGKGIAGLTNILSQLIENVEIPKTVLIKKISESCQVLLDLHFKDTANRRKLVMYSLDKKFVQLVQDVKRDAWLFGANLAEKIKASKTAERSGLQIKRSEPQASTSSRPDRFTPRQGNSSGPLKQRNQRYRSSGPRQYVPPQATTRRPAQSANRYATTGPPKPYTKPARKTN